MRGKRIFQRSLGALLLGFGLLTSPVRAEIQGVTLRVHGMT